MIRLEQILKEWKDKWMNIIKSENTTTHSAYIILFSYWQWRHSPLSVMTVLQLYFKKLI